MESPFVILAGDFGYGPEATGTLLRHLHEIPLGDSGKDRLSGPTEHSTLFLDFEEGRAEAVLLQSRLKAPRRTHRGEASDADRRHHPSVLRQSYAIYLGIISDSVLVRNIYCIRQLARGKVLAKIDGGRCA